MQRFIRSFANDAAIQSAVDDKTLGKPYVALDVSAGTIDWNTKSDTPDYSKMYLTFDVLENGNINIRTTKFNLLKSMQYKVNDGDWVGIVTSTDGLDIPVLKGDSVQFKGDNNRYASNGNFNTFGNSTAQFSLKGNIMSLVYGDNFIGEESLYGNDTFYRMFMDCTGLTSIENLILPATTLTTNCYYGLFKNCKSITTTPELPAPILARTCYQDMFAGCTNLNYVKCLATDITTAIECTLDWVANVSPTGTFVKKAGVSWPTGNSGIPSGWTVIEE